MDFGKLRRRDAKEELQRLRKHVRFDIGEHKTTKLNAVLGRRAGSTLLDKDISATHANRLFAQFRRRWGHLTKAEELQRLRFWTVLDSVELVDPDGILAAVERMEGRLRGALRRVKGVEVIGAAEIEIVNLKKMRELAGDDNEARKLHVLTGLVEQRFTSIFDKKHDSYALVHFHGIVDLGRHGDEKEEVLRKASDAEWSGRYQVEIKSTFQDKSLMSSLEHIASYLVKGGNESLIYKIGFGRDSVEALERQMLKVGKTPLGGDFEGFENEFSLSAFEIEVLGTAIDKLMRRRGSRNMRNGYLFKYGQQNRQAR